MSELHSISETNPALFNRIVNHPEIQVVAAYFILESMQFHTLYRVSQEMIRLGYTKEQITEAYKLYMETGE
jgi:hypothetical protein